MTVYINWLSDKHTKALLLEYDTHSDELEIGIISCNRDTKCSTKYIYAVHFSLPILRILYSFECINR